MSVETTLMLGVTPAENLPPLDVPVKKAALVYLVSEDTEEIYLVSDKKATWQIESGFKWKADMSLHWGGIAIDGFSDPETVCYWVNMALDCSKTPQDLVYKGLVRVFQEGFDPIDITVYFIRAYPPSWSPQVIYQANQKCNFAVWYRVLDLFSKLNPLESTIWNAIIGPSLTSKERGWALRILGYITLKDTHFVSSELRVRNM